MEQQISLTPSYELPELTEAQQEELVGFINDCEKKGCEARKPFEDDWKECDRLYRCEPEPLEDADLEWQSNLVLPWAYDAVESAFAHLHNTMIPRNDDVFTLEGRTQEDHPGADTMGTYMEAALDRIRYSDRVGKGLRQLLRKNHTCAKVYFKKDIEVGYDPATDSFNERTTYNNVWIDIIDIEDFVFWPIYGDINKTTRIHTTYRFLEELHDAASMDKTLYFNLDKLTDDDNKPATSAALLNPKDEKERKREGIKLKEAWIHRVKIDGVVYHNIVATVANDKWLIRFKRNKYSDGGCPLIWIPLMPEGNCNYGYGLISKGIPVLKAANFLFNQRLNEIILKMYGSWKYWDDGVFNPYNMISRPGALIEMSGPESVAANLMPLNPGLEQIQLAYAEVNELKAEFESVTVPKVVKGLIEAGDRTATEISGVQNNASGKLHTMAFHINENWLKPLFERVYAILYSELVRGNEELKLDVARTTQPAVDVIDVDDMGQPLPQPQVVQKSEQQLISELPQFLPLPEIDIQVVGYQNMLRKQETLQNMDIYATKMAESPAGQYLKWDGIAEIGAESLDIDKSRVVLDEEGRKRVDAETQRKAEMQEQLMIAAEKEKLDLQRFKEEAKVQIELKKLELQEMEMMLKYQQQQQMELNAAQTAFEDSESEKEKASNAK